VALSTITLTLTPYMLAVTTIGTAEAGAMRSENLPSIS
jgi:hypothetical protein